VFWFTKKQKPFIAALPEKHSKGVLDINSATWQYVVERATDEIKKARFKNDNPNLSDNQTAIIRGRIKAFKSVIAWPEDRKGILNR